jgi:telomerase Cajal body protein 1
MHVPACHDHLYEVTAAAAVAFAANGAKLFTGFKDCIRIFHTERPGRECETLSLKSRQGGQGGIVSSFAFVPVADGLFACGSYAGTVGLYDGATGQSWATMRVGGGVTQLAFSQDGISLFCGCRKSRAITVWDVRNVSKPVSLIPRASDTNQRIGFDLRGDRLVTGSTGGEVLVYDTAEVATGGGSQPVTTFVAHQDAVNGVSLHPDLPLLATSSGQRRFQCGSPVDGENRVKIFYGQW